VDSSAGVVKLLCSCCRGTANIRVRAFPLWSAPLHQTSHRAWHHGRIAPTCYPRRALPKIGITTRTVFWGERRCNSLDGGKKRTWRYLIVETKAMFTITVFAKARQQCRPIKGSLTSSNPVRCPYPPSHISSAPRSQTTAPKCPQPIPPQSLPSSLRSTAQRRRPDPRPAY